MQTIQKLAYKYANLTMKMEETCYSKTVISTYKTDAAQPSTAETEHSQKLEQRILYDNSESYRRTLNSVQLSKSSN